VASSRSLGAGSRSIRAGPASAEVHPEHGGLVGSVAIDGVELLAPVVPGRPGVPRGGSFLLAPWVGELSGGRLPFRGEEHRMPTDGGRHAVHGLVGSGAWEVEDHGQARLTIRRELGPPWPYGGSVRQAFALDPNGMTHQAEVVAGARAMPVSLGWHPWFRVVDPERVSLSVDAGRHLELDDELIPTGRTLDVAGDVDLRDGPTLGRRRIDVVYVDATPPVRLTLPDRSLTVDFDPRIRYLVVYVSDGSLCIEPWTSWPDAPNAAERGLDAGLVALEPGERLERWMRWSWRSSDGRPRSGLG
jgi:aldose 1-epimerase